MSNQQLKVSTEIEKAKGSVIFTTTHADTLGNANRIELIKFLSKSFDLTVYAEPYDFGCQVFEGIKVSPIVSSNNSNRLSLPLFGKLLSWYDMARVVNNDNSDFVFMIVSTSPAAFFIRKPLFQYVHQYGERARKKSINAKSLLKKLFLFFKNYMISYALKKSVCNFVVSDQVNTTLVNYGVTNTIVTKHGVDLDKFRIPAIKSEHDILIKLREERKFIVGYTGWVNEDRGLDIMLEMARLFNDQGDEIVIVLAGANEQYSNKISKYMSEHALTNIIDMGIVNSSLIPGILHCCDVCLSLLDPRVPAFHVSPPQKIIEYFAAGKPVVCNHLSTHKALVRDAWNGCLIEFDAQDACNRIYELRDDAETLVTFSKNASESAIVYGLSSSYQAMISTITRALFR